ncbi:MAG: Gfo/Idh/MocA family oxidoreductase [Thermoanaerobaculia bacterium]
MINIGFVGAGDIATVHAQAVAEVNDGRLVAVTDVIPERARALAAQHGAAAVTDLEQLLRIPGLDVLYILTPPQFHAAQITDAAAAGIPVMCEKPLTVSLAEADQALGACKEAGVPLMTGLSHRFHPLAARAKALLQQGELGQFVAAWSHRLIMLPVSPDSWLNVLAVGGGLTLQYAMHDLDWECWLGGDVVQVAAYEAHTNPQLQIEDNLWALLQFRQGGSGTVGVSWSAPHSWTERGVIGSQGNLRIVQQKRLVGQLANGRVLDEELGDDYDWQDVFIRESQDIVDRVKRGLPFSVSGEDGRRALEISLAVQRAAQSQQMVSLPLSAAVT